MTSVGAARQLAADLVEAAGLTALVAAVGGAEAGVCGFGAGGERQEIEQVGVGLAGVAEAGEGLDGSGELDALFGDDLAEGRGQIAAEEEASASGTPAGLGDGLLEGEVGGLAAELAHPALG